MHKILRVNIAYFNFFRKSSQDPYDQSDSAPLRRSSSRSSAGGNYQDPNGIRRNGVGERSRVNIPLDFFH